MREQIDLYDQNGKRTGRRAFRGEPRKPGEYHLAVAVWIANRRGEFLIQKRAGTKSSLPGLWVEHGGGVLAGEDGFAAALREVREEIGMALDPKNVYYLERIVGEKDLFDVFLAIQDYQIETAVLNPEEVSELMWADEETLHELYRNGLFFRYPEWEDIFQKVKSRLRGG